MNQKYALILFIIILLSIAWLVGLVTSTDIDNWYSYLNHPSISPPNWVFAPVWSFLYILIAIAGWMIWRVHSFKSKAMKWYFLQLILNFAWTFIFFLGHALGWALFEILILDIVVIVTIVEFYQLNRLAALLLMPYLAWISFATILNVGYWWLNA